jgi:hypothetical protein
MPSTSSVGLFGMCSSHFILEPARCQYIPRIQFNKLSNFVVIFGSPAADEYVPFPQAVHEPDFTPEYVPPPQIVQYPDWAAEYLPASQSVQVQDSIAE